MIDESNYGGVGLADRPQIIQHEDNPRERIEASIREILARYPGDPDFEEIQAKLAALHKEEDSENAQRSSGDELPS